MDSSQNKSQELQQILACHGFLVLISLNEIVYIEPFVLLLKCVDYPQNCPIIAQ